MTDRTDTDTLPPPDCWRITDGEGGHVYYDEQPNEFSRLWAQRHHRKHERLYTADTVRRLIAEAREAGGRMAHDIMAEAGAKIAERDERIARLEEALRRIVEWDDSGLAPTEDHIAQARAALECTHGR